MGEKGAMDVIQSIPSTEEELSNVVWRIHQALHPSDGKSPQPETVHEALTPFQRNTKLLSKLSDKYKQEFSKLNDEYQQEFQTDLKVDIEQNLTGNSLKYALYLIGDQEMETKVISQDELMPLLRTGQAK